MSFTSLRALRSVTSRFFSAIDCSRPQAFVHLEQQDDVGLVDQAAAPVRQVEVVGGGEVGAAAGIDHRRVQRLGELDQAVDAGLGAAPCGRRR